MNWKSTSILVTVAAVLFAFVWLVERPIRHEKLLDANRAILPGLDTAAVKSIIVQPRGLDEIQVALAEGTTNTWQLTRPISYPAQAEPIRALLEALAALQWQERIPAGDLRDQPDAQEKYGFSQPLCAISLQTGSAVSRKVLVGQTSALGDQAFLEVVGDPNIYLVSASLLQATPFDKNQWRDLSLISPSTLSYQSIQIRTPGRGLIDLELDPTNRLWAMTKPVLARGDGALIRALLQRLEGVRVQQFITDDPHSDMEPFGLQASPQTPTLDLTFWSGTNVVSALQVGASPTNQPNLAYARRNDPLNVVLISRELVQVWQASYTNFLDYHFISIPPEQIGRITVTGSEGRFWVERESGDRWTVHASTNFPADPGLMRDWLAGFTNIPTQIEETVATDLALYGLKHPAFEYTLHSPGATGPSNAVLAQLQFGTNRSGHAFEHRPDETFVNSISGEDHNHLPSMAWQLRDRTIWSFAPSNILSLTIHQQGYTRKYLRDPSGDWTFAPGFHGPPMVNWPGLEEAVFRIGHLQAVYWSGVGDLNWRKFGFQVADFKLSFETSKNGQMETNTISFGGRSPFTYPYASVVLNGQRVIFEFPADLYENFVQTYMTIPPEARHRP